MASLASQQGGELSRGVTVACAFACGAMVANLYYGQPLIALIAPDLHLGASVGGLVTTLTMLGYGGGLLLVVPLADRIENRRLILATLGLTAIALVGLAAAPSALFFLAASLAVGFCAAGAQVVLPYAASLTPPERRGRTIGNVMSGLLTGIMLARPVASLVAHFAGWRAVFGLSAALMLVTMLLMARALPERRPAARESYGAILRSLGRIFLREPALRRRAAYQGLTFIIFNIFWTTVPLLLAERFGFGQIGIGVFALIGAAGALAAPIAGRMGDRGLVRQGTAGALTVVLLSAVVAGWAGTWQSLLLLVIVALTFDAATQVNQVLSQRVVYALPGEERGRINAVYMTCMFLLGSGGAAFATVAYHAGGWQAAMGLAAAIGLVALLFFATEFWGEFRASRRAR